MINIKYWYSEILIPLNTLKNNIDSANCIIINLDDDTNNNKLKIIETIEWCNEHDEECKTIASNASKLYTKMLRLSIWWVRNLKKQKRNYN